MHSSQYTFALYAFLVSIFLVDKNHVKCARNTREPPTVEIPGQGVISGKEVMVSRAKSTVFLGVPFANPPVGDLRFAPPQTSVTPWSGIRNGSEYGPACMQNRQQFLNSDRLLLKLLPDIDFSEDCLYLNLFIPDGQAPSEGWPVMLWFHSGNLNTGAPHLWDGTAFATRQKVLIVTAAYRLNIFGFFSTLDNLAPGNLGLLDQVAALDWVVGKVVVFGGNPESIILCGHGGGGTGIGLHLVSPLSRGKFVRAISMSSRGLISRSVKTESLIRIRVHDVADIFLCELKSAPLLACLRRLPAESLLEHAAGLADEFGPIIDINFANNSKAFLKADPLDLIKSEDFAKVPLLIGYCDSEDALELIEVSDNTERGMSWDEFTLSLMTSVAKDVADLNVNDSCLEDLATKHLADTVTFYYTPSPLTNDLTALRDRYVDFTTDKYYGSGAYLTASALSAADVNTFLYRFDYKIKTDAFIRFPKNHTHLANWINTPHTFDLPFVWGMPYWTHLLKNITWNSADKKMADVVLTLWGNFMKYGNPTHSGINLKWDAFRNNISGVMLLDRNSNMSDLTSLDYKAFEFWNNYYPKVWNVLLESCNMTSGEPERAATPVSLLHIVLASVSVWCWWFL